MDSALTDIVIDYKGGVAIAIFLLLILGSLFRLDKVYAMPKFCTACIHLSYRPFNTYYCKLRCKFNPKFRHSHLQSFYEKGKR